MKHKHFLFLVLAALCLVAFSACSSDDDDDVAVDYTGAAFLGTYGEGSESLTLKADGSCTADLGEDGSFDGTYTADGSVISASIAGYSIEFTYSSNELTVVEADSALSGMGFSEGAAFKKKTA